MPGIGAQRVTLPAADAVSVELLFARPAKCAFVAVPTVVGSPSARRTTVPVTEPVAPDGLVGSPDEMEATVPEATAAVVVKSNPPAR